MHLLQNRVGNRGYDKREEYFINFYYYDVKLV